VIRVVFLGTPAFAVPTLSALLDSPEIEVLAAITQPDRKSGRGHKRLPPPVKVLALDREVPVFQYPSIRKSPEAVSLLKEFKPDVCVVVAFGQILPVGFFDLPALGTLNVHASILPAYRGAAPVIHSLLNGEVESGITIMKIDKGMDTGQILDIQKIQIPITMNAGELELVLSVEGAGLLVNTLIGYSSGEISPVEQDHNLATYAPRIVKDMAQVVWENDAPAIHNRIRAMNPKPGAFTSFRNVEAKIWKSGLVSSSGGKGLPGSIIDISSNSIVVECGNHTLLDLLELQMPNRKKVSAADFVNGNRLEITDTFG